MPPALADFLGTTHQSIVINGQRREARSEKTIDVRDPGTGEVIAQIAAGEADDVDLAVTEDRRALEEERRETNPARRERALLHLAALIVAKAEELAQLGTLDVGKPATPARYADL